MSTQPLSRTARAQRGAALIVVLVLLLVMTLLGLASLRGTIMEERMSANMLDRSLAFQAAEAALREAEARLLAPGIGATFPTAADTCIQGLCSEPVPAEGVLDRAERPGFDGWFNATRVNELAGTPQYFIEYMGEGPSWFQCEMEVSPHPLCMKPRYRISARSVAQGRAQVVLQASIAGQ